MMGNEGIGECSQQSSDDKTNEDGDRPLKKAKYMWQVKGKYHLKGPSASSSQNRIPPIQQPPTFEEDEDDPISDNGTESINNNEPTNNNIVEQVCHSRRCCLHTILDYSDSDVDSVSSTESQLNEEWEDVVSMVSPKSDDDYHLHKWQSRQWAKGLVDNTINRILDNGMRPQGCNDPYHFLNLRDDSDDNIEDEGILMAIQSHGLQPADSTFDNVHNEMRQLHATAADEANDSSQNEDEGSDDYHSNFMKAAISAAIHEKGLSSENHE